MKKASLWAATPLLMFHFEGPVVWKAVPNKEKIWPNSTLVNADLSTKDLEGQLWQKPNGDFSLQIAITFKDFKNQVLETNKFGVHKTNGKLKTDQTPLKMSLENGPSKVIATTCNMYQCVGEWTPLPWDWTKKTRLFIDSQLQAKKDKSWTLVLETAPIQQSGFLKEEHEEQKLPFGAIRKLFLKPKTFADWSWKANSPDDLFGYFQVLQGEQKVFQNTGDPFEILLSEEGSNLVKTYRVAAKSFFVLESKKIFALRSRSTSLSLREQVEVK